MDKHLLIHRICKLLNTSLYVENKYGIKVYNKPLSVISEQYLSEEITIDAASTFLGFDCLRNEYSLVNRSILLSPHYDLISKLYVGQNIDGSDYICRETEGCLDGRYGIVPANHSEAMNNAITSVESDNYSPAIIYDVCGKWYIFDGKHRLALCALLGLNCRCRTLSREFFLSDSYTLNVYKRMKHKLDYDLNTKLLDNILYQKKNYFDDY